MQLLTNSAVSRVSPALPDVFSTSLHGRCQLNNGDRCRSAVPIGYIILAFFVKFIFINIEIHDKAISENLRHLIRHVEIAVNFIDREVKSQFAISRVSNVVILAMTSKFVVGEAAAAAVSLRRGSSFSCWSESSSGKVKQRSVITSDIVQFLQI